MHELTLSDALVVEDWKAGHGPEEGPGDLGQRMKVAAPHNYEADSNQQTEKHHGGRLPRDGGESRENHDARQLGTVLELGSELEESQDSRPELDLAS